MNIGIVGAGAVGSAIAGLLARAGIDARILNRRGPDRLTALTAAYHPHITQGTREEVLGADLVFVAVPWGRLAEALGGVDWAGRIVVDANNPIDGPAFKAVDLGGRTSSEAFADFVPGARVVKAFNHLNPHFLASDPHSEGGRRVLFLAGDDVEAKQEVRGLIEKTGFLPVDLGGLAEGGRQFQFPGGPLAAHNFVRFD